MISMLKETQAILENVSPIALKQVYEFVKKAPKYETLSPEEEKELQEIEAEMDAGIKYSIEDILAD